MHTKDADKFRNPEDTDFIEELDDLDKNKLTELAKKEFNITDKEWNSKVETQPLISEKTVDDIASLNKYFAERLENALSGKRLERTGKGEEKWVQSGKAVAGTLLINSCIGIIGTFANKPMLISGAKEEDFNMQFEDAFRKISDLIIMPQTYLDVNCIRTILKEFKDTFWNMGAIITKTGRNMSAYFDSLRAAQDDFDQKMKSKLGD